MLIVNRDYFLLIVTIIDIDENSCLGGINMSPLLLLRNRYLH